MSRIKSFFEEYGILAFGVGIALLIVGLLGWGILGTRLSETMHTFWWLIIRHPIGVTFGIVALLVTLVTVFLWYDGDGPTWWFVATIVLWIGFAAYGIYSNALYHSYLASSQDPVALTSLSDTTSVRWLPEGVAKNFGTNKYQNSFTTLDNFQPIEQTDGTIDWTAAQVPNGFWNSFGTNQSGIVIIKPDGSIQLVNHQFRYGQGMFFEHGYAWHLYSIHYNIELDDPYYLLTPDGQDILMVVPYEGFHFEFPENVPYWRGVFIVHTDGTVEDLSPNAAMTDSRLTGQRLFPLNLATDIANSWEYKNGIWNAWFTHHSQVDVPTIDNSDNQPPYLVPSQDGPQWVVPTEPYGNTNHGIFQMLVWDAHSGEMSIHTLSQDSALIGPNKAAGYIQKAYPLYNWKTDSGGNIVAYEPRPVVRSGVLYWQLTVSTSDEAGVTLTALVNANTSEIRVFDTTQELVQFLNGTYEGGVPPGTSTPVSCVSGTNPSQLSDQQLIQLLQQLADELAKRQQH